MNIAITGGGTGGHLAIAKAIKEALNKRGIEPLFIGSTAGQDRAWFEEDSGWGGCFFLETSGVVNKKGLAKFHALKNIFQASMQAKKLLKAHKIDVVFSVGGYAAAPASLAAIMSGKDFYIHEQNAVIGRLNKLLIPRAKMLFSSYHVYHDNAVTDYPVREIFFKQARIRTRLKCLIFLGGSQGATAINDLALSLAKKLHDKGIKIIHQCGSQDLQRCQDFYHDKGIDAEVFAFSKRLESKIEEADFAVARAGAGTVWELTASGLPALFVPYPYAAGNHQYHNAKFLHDKGLALLCKQDALEPKVLEEILSVDITKVSEGLSQMISPNGAEKIVDVITSHTTTS